MSDHASSTTETVSDERLRELAVLAYFGLPDEFRKDVHSALTELQRLRSPSGAEVKPLTVQEFVRADDATRERVGEGIARRAFARQSPEPSGIHPARLENVANWLDNGCDPRHAATELRMMANVLRGPALDEAGRVSPEPGDKS